MIYYFKSFIVLVSILFLFSASMAQNKRPSNFPLLKGPYLGQKPPGKMPLLFAPNIISNGFSNRDVAISSDGKEMYFGLNVAKYLTIIETHQVDGIWSKPKVLPFASDSRYKYFEPTLSPDGNKMFFLSNMPIDGSSEPSDEDIWVVDRTESGWGKPYNLGAPINSKGNEFFPSLTNDETMYFTRGKAGERINFIYRSKLVNGKYTEPEKLPKQVNCGTNRFNAYIAPDESYIVVPALGVEGGLGGVDYYIVFRNDDDTWCEPINMGDKINSATGREWSFYVSPDQKYIFYMASKEPTDSSIPKKLSIDFFNKLVNIPENGQSDIYWIDAGIIDELKNQK